MIAEIALITKIAGEKDALGQIPMTDSKTDVFAEVESITQTEFMNAGQMGFRPELRFKVWRTEYSGESIVKYDGKYYSIYRTYEADNGRIELYAERRVGSGYDTGESVDQGNNGLTE